MIIMIIIIKLIILVVAINHRDSASRLIGLFVVVPN